MQNTEPRKYKVKRDCYSRKCYKSAFQIKRRRCWFNGKRIHIFNIVIKIENAPDLMQVYMKCNNFFTIPKCLSVSNNSRSSCALDPEKRIVLIKNPFDNVKTTVFLKYTNIFHMLHTLRLRLAKAIYWHLFKTTESDRGHDIQKRKRD